MPTDNQTSELYMSRTLRTNYEGQISRRENSSASLDRSADHAPHHYCASANHFLRQVFPKTRLAAHALPFCGCAESCRGFSFFARAYARACHYAKLANVQLHARLAPPHWARAPRSFWLQQSFGCVLERCAGEVSKTC